MFYVIMRGVTIFSVHYETVTVQISLWWAAIVLLIDGKHWFLTYITYTYSLSRISSTAWWARRTRGSGEALCQAKKISFNTHIIHTCIMHRKELQVLASILQSGHTWEKGMHEAIWDSL